MICLDNTFLALLFHPTAAAPDDPNTGQPITQLEERIEFVKQTWIDTKETIIIPTPALAEFLILAKADGPKYLDAIDKTTHFEIHTFDERSAVELAAIYLLNWNAAGKRGKKTIDKVQTAAKVKFDRQIVAIAKVNGATAIFSDDDGVETFAKQNGIQVTKTWMLPIPAPKHPLLVGIPPETVVPFVEDDEKELVEIAAIAPLEDGDGETVISAAIIEKEIAEEKPKAIAEDGLGTGDS